MELTKETRWVLLNQYRLLRKLEPDAAEECERAIDALESGYELEYDELVPALCDAPMSKDECREFVDILNMHRELHWSFDDLADKSAVNERDGAFGGFDGNHETRALGYARFLINENRWAELAGSGDGLNSHCPMMDAYRRMLSVWRACREKRRETRNRVGVCLAQRGGHRRDLRSTDPPGEQGKGWAGDITRMTQRQVGDVVDGLEAERFGHPDPIEVTVDQALEYARLLDHQRVALVRGRRRIGDDPTLDDVEKRRQLRFQQQIIEAIEERRDDEMQRMRTALSRLVELRSREQIARIDGAARDDIRRLAAAGSIADAVAYVHRERL